nr:hypothetical protein [uncultured Dysosmobacter sp.]
MCSRNVTRHHAGLILRLGAVIILAALAFYWGLRVGYETARPWELTAYGEYDAAQLQNIVEGTREHISDLQDKLDRALAALREKQGRPPPDPVADNAPVSNSDTGAPYLVEYLPTAELVPKTRIYLGNYLQIAGKR